jgi:hypothetical protein
MQPQLPVEIYCLIVLNALQHPLDAKQPDDDDTRLLLSLVKTCRLFHSLFEHHLYQDVNPYGFWVTHEPVDYSFDDWRRYCQVLRSIGSNQRIANHVRDLWAVAHPYPEDEDEELKDMWELFKNALARMKNLKGFHLNTSYPTTSRYRQHLSSCLLAAPFELILFRIHGIILKADMEVYIDFFKLQPSISAVCWDCNYRDGTTWQVRDAVDSSILPNLRRLDIQFCELALMLLPGRKVEHLRWSEGSCLERLELSPNELPLISTSLRRVKKLELFWQYPPISFSEVAPHLKRLRHLC